MRPGWRSGATEVELGRDDAEGSVSRREGARGLKGKSDMSGQTSERRGVWAFGAKCAGDSWVLGRSAGEVQRKDVRVRVSKGGGRAEGGAGREQVYV